ncbi:hypothetical protein H2200_006806 [Cladophialophora chaetospira]|uniref:Uncharacterized protein n=1 Tax=Cladophialophora chaetospira TaxID=386627 RepID=A0AA38X930_9EURO|nr:hypothetical protein H2200_006806 [Cladophialophora chaetospira]
MPSQDEARDTAGSQAMLKSAGGRGSASQVQSEHDVEFSLENTKKRSHQPTTEYSNDRAAKLARTSECCDADKPQQSELFSVRQQEAVAAELLNTGLLHGEPQQKSEKATEPNASTTLNPVSLDSFDTFIARLGNQAAELFRPQEQRLLLKGYQTLLENLEGQSASIEPLRESIRMHIARLRAELSWGEMQRVLARDG